MSPIQLDTTQAATDTIQYVVTDQNGLTSTSTRTVIVRASDSPESPTGVIIDPAQAPSIVPVDASTTSAATHIGRSIRNLNRAINSDAPPVAEFS